LHKYQDVVENVNSMKKKKHQKKNIKKKQKTFKYIYKMPDASITAIARESA
jgi:hypothetical protein